MSVVFTRSYMRGIWTTDWLLMAPSSFNRVYSLHRVNYFVSDYCPIKNRESFKCLKIWWLVFCFFVNVNLMWELISSSKYKPNTRRTRIDGLINFRKIVPHCTWILSWRAIPLKIFTNNEQQLWQNLSALLMN